MPATRHIQAIRGMEDALPGRVDWFQRIEQAARALFGRARYVEIRTPILEPTELFARSAGGSSDIVVSKQMYTFTDPGERSNTMRPEGTAGVVRALVEHGVLKETAQQKLFYIGPMFRYEKPQKGRLRQFHQVGVEVFGIAHAAADAEVIALSRDFLRELGFADVVVKLNNLGDREDRREYNKHLREAIAGTAGWCEQCAARAEANPMRVFDCKEEGCRRLLEGLPRIGQFVGASAMEHFDTMRRLLDAVGVTHEMDEGLVRGLDYYSRTVFEIMEAGIGAQSTMIGGGRYDYLCEELGGPATPAVGMSAGVERLILAMEARGIAAPARPAPRVYIIALDEASMTRAFEIAGLARAAGADAAFDLQPRSAKAGLKAANKTGAQAAILIGETELARGVVQWKDLESATQVELDPDTLNARLGAGG